MPDTWSIATNIATRTGLSSHSNPIVSYNGVQLSRSEYLVLSQRYDQGVYFTFRWTNPSTSPFANLALRDFFIGSRIAVLAEHPYNPRRITYIYELEGATARMETNAFRIDFDNTDIQLANDQSHVILIARNEEDINKIEQVYIDGRDENFRLHNIVRYKHRYGDSSQRNETFHPVASYFEVESFLDDKIITQVNDIRFLIPENKPEEYEYVLNPDITGFTRLDKLSKRHYAGHLYKRTIVGNGVFTDITNNSIRTRLLRDTSAEDCIRFLIASLYGVPVTVDGTTDQPDFPDDHAIHDYIEFEGTDSGIIMNYWWSDGMRNVYDELQRLLNMLGPEARLDDYQGHFKVTTLPRNPIKLIFSGPKAIFGRRTQFPDEGIVPDEAITYTQYEETSEEEDFFNTVDILLYDRSAIALNTDTNPLWASTNTVDILPLTTLTIEVKAQEDLPFKISSIHTREDNSNITSGYAIAGVDSGSVVDITMTNTSTSIQTVTPYVLGTVYTINSQRLFTRSEFNEGRDPATGIARNPNNIEVITHKADLDFLPDMAYTEDNNGVPSGHVLTLLDRYLKVGTEGREIITYTVVSSMDINKERHQKILALRPSDRVGIVSDKATSSLSALTTLDPVTPYSEGIIRTIETTKQFNKSDLTIFRITCEVERVELGTQKFILGLDMLGGAKTIG